MLARDGGEQRLSQHALRRQLRPRDRRPQQPGIDLPRGKRLELIAGHHLLQREVDFGQPRPARREQFRQVAVSGRRRVTDLERPGLAERDAARDLRCALGEFQYAARLGQEAAARGRQPHRAAGTLQQWRVDDVFQHLDLPGERRLRHVEPCRRATEVQLFRDRDKTAELVQVEHRCMPGMDEALICRFLASISPKTKAAVCEPPP